MKKKIIFGVFCGFVILSTISQISPYIALLFDEPRENSFSWHILMFFGSMFMDILVVLTLILTVIGTIEFIFKHSNASNFVRYTYEEYKEYRARKKEGKQAQKKAKLQEQREKLEVELQEMEKTE